MGFPSQSQVFGSRNDFSKFLDWDQFLKFLGLGISGSGLELNSEKFGIGTGIDF